MTRGSALAASALAALLLVAAAPDAPPPPAGGWVTRDTGDLLVLDKVSAKATPLTLRVGQSADNASLSIVLRSCVVRPADQVPDAAAYLDIRDSHVGGPGFHGWMLRNEPALSMLEHPVYDVRLVGCR